MTEHTLVDDTRLPTTSRRPHRGLHVGARLWSPAPVADAPFRPWRTAAPQGTQAMVRTWAERDAQVVLTTVPRNVHPAPATFGRAEVLGLPTRSPEDLPVGRTLMTALSRARDVDVVHLHLHRSGALAALAAVSAARPAPMIVHLWTSAGVPLRSGGTATVRSRLVDGLLESRILADAAAVVTPTPRLAELARRAGCEHVEVLPAPLAVPIDLSDVPPPEGGRVIVSVGPLTARRRPEALVQALAVQPPDAELVLVGSGPRHAEVRRTAERLGVRERVRVVADATTWRAVVDQIARADVVASAALSGEDATPALIAQWLGRPVVMTAVEAMPVQVSDGIDGHLVPPGDDDALTAAVRTVLTTSDHAAALGASARRRAAAATWATRAERVDEVVSQVLSHH